jgi:hypothetical protein
MVKILSLALIFGVSLVAGIVDAENSVCDVVNKRIEKGVIDSKGVQHPGYPGWTNPNLKGTWTPQNIDKQTVSKIKCPCTGNLYDSAAECQSNCQASLACLASCSGVQAVRLKATIGVTFSAKPTKSKLDLTPARKLKKECKDHVTSLATQVNQHENRHVKDIQRAVNDYNDKAVTVEVEAVGETEVKANAELDRLAKEQLDKEGKALADQINQDADDFHNTPAGKPVVVDCNKCP